ncbi:UNVERIFIED_CONTAM: hypothetical protein HDU68_004929 [Siphonaria sp. JEL0065]|nr:hypothetical protein HDU68_004929 [Siphonaria sp. JEL0065]
MTNSVVKKMAKTETSESMQNHFKKLWAEANDNERKRCYDMALYRELTAKNIENNKAKGEKEPMKKPEKPRSAINLFLDKFGSSGCEKEDCARWMALGKNGRLPFVNQHKTLKDAYSRDNKEYLQKTGHGKIKKFVQQEALSAFLKLERRKARLEKLRATNQELADKIENRKSYYAKNQLDERKSKNALLTSSTSASPSASNTTSSSKNPRNEKIATWDSLTTSSSRWQKLGKFTNDRNDLSSHIKKQLKKREAESMKTMFMLRLLTISTVRQFTTTKQFDVNAVLRTAIRHDAETRLADLEATLASSISSSDVDVFSGPSSGFESIQQLDSKEQQSVPIIKQQTVHLRKFEKADALKKGLLQRINQNEKKSPDAPETPHSPFKLFLIDSAIDNRPHEQDLDALVAWVKEHEARWAKMTQVQKVKYYSESRVLEGKYKLARLEFNAVRIL